MKPPSIVICNSFHTIFCFHYLLTFVSVFSPYFPAKYPPFDFPFLPITLDNFEAFHTMKFEEKAIAMFNRFRKAMKLFPLVLIPSSCARVPAAVKMSGEFVHELSVNLCNPHVVFLIGNAIIAVLLVLCRHTDASSEAYDDSVRQGEIQPRAASCQVYAPPPLPEAKEKAVVKALATEEEIKQIVCSESVVPKQQSEEIFVALEMATKQIQKIHRTQSEKLKRETALRSQRDLRHSETELSLKAVSSSDTGTKSVDTVENLSNEEFRLRIEKFIRKNQEFFKLENGRDETQRA